MCNKICFQGMLATTVPALISQTSDNMQVAYNFVVRIILP